VKIGTIRIVLSNQHANEVQEEARHPQEGRNYFHPVEMYDFFKRQEMLQHCGKGMTKRAETEQMVQRICRPG
jgi:hypothetical protein